MLWPDSLHLCLSEQNCKSASEEVSVEWSIQSN